MLWDAKPYSIGGSLPLVRNMQRCGFDEKMTGFGLMSTYHAAIEYCLLSDIFMRSGFEITSRSSDKSSWTSSPDDETAVSARRAVNRPFGLRARSGAARRSVCVVRLSACAGARTCTVEKKEIVSLVFCITPPTAPGTDALKARC